VNRIARRQGVKSESVPAYNHFKIPVIGSWSFQISFQIMEAHSTSS
jgi:hypothetical protein